MGFATCFGMGTCMLRLETVKGKKRMRKRRGERRFSVVRCAASWTPRKEKAKVPLPKRKIAFDDLSVGYSKNFGDDRTSVQTRSIVSYQIQTVASSWGRSLLSKQDPYVAEKRSAV